MKQIALWVFVCVANFLLVNSLNFPPKIFSSQPVTIALPLDEYELTVNDLKRLKDAVNMLQSKAQLTVKQLPDFIDTESHDFARDLRMNIHRERNESLISIDEWKYKAAQLHINIDKCTDLKEEQLKVLYDHFLSFISDCFTGQYYETTNNLRVLEVEINNIGDLVQSLDEDLEQCAGKNRPECRAKVHGFIRQNFKLLPQVIEAKVNQSINISDSHKSKLMKNCLDGKLEYVLRFFKFISKSIVDCIRNTIKLNTIN